MRGENRVKTIQDFENCSISELKLWIIQELSATDSKCWWFVNEGVRILKKKMEKEE